MLNDMGEEVYMAKGKQAQALAIKLSRERRAGKEVPPAPKADTPSGAEKKRFTIFKLVANRRGREHDGAHDEWR